MSANLKPPGGTLLDVMGRAADLLKRPDREVTVIVKEGGGTLKLEWTPDAPRNGKGQGWQQ